MKEQAAGRPSFAAAKANVKAEANFITGIELMRGIYFIAGGSIMKKTFKKSMAVILCAVMLLGVAVSGGFSGVELPLGITASAAEHSGYCGSTANGADGTNLSWSFDETTGTLTFTGSGEMEDYEAEYWESSTTPWHDFSADIIKAVLPDGLTRIGDCAFWACMELDNIEILDSVTSIGEDAFYGTGIYETAIDENGNRDDLYIGNILIYVCDLISGEYVVKSDTRLIAENAFLRSSDSSISAVRIDSSNPYYTTRDGVLYNKDITELIYYPRDKSSDTYKIPDGVTTIRKEAFSWNDILKHIEIPGSVIYIEKNPFYSCEKLSLIIVNENNASYSSEDGVLFNKAKTELIQYPVGNSRTSYTIPSSVTSIGDHAFDGCESLKNITIPNSVTSIGDFAFYWCSNLTSLTIPSSVTSIGNHAFVSCDGLTSVTIPNSVTSIGDYAFARCAGMTSITIPNSVTNIGEGTFSECFYLTSITIPNSVTSIGEGAFGVCCNLTSITIPNSVTSIGYNAFSDCESLTSITIPNSVTSIGDYAFGDCYKLTDITVDSNNINYCSEDGVLFNKAKTELIHCPAGNSRTSYTIPSSVTSIGDFAFASCNSLTSITIPNSVTSIGDSAFWGCHSLTSLTIPNSVTSIGDYAFAGVSMTSITIPNSVTSIGNYAFCGCDGLTSITIPNSVTSIGEDAFGNCGSLTSITIPNSVTSIGDWTFWNCKSLTSITIPNSVTSIGDYAFYDCSSLTSITMPNSVTSIGKEAFWGCDCLISVTIPNSVTSIGEIAFCYCDSLTSITVDSNNANYSSLDGVLFNKAKTELIQYPAGNSRTSYIIPDSVTSIGNEAFRGCNSLTSITVDSGSEHYSSVDGVLLNKAKTELIQYPAGNSRTSYIIPDSVTSIGKGAFDYNNLVSIVLPIGVKEIYSYAFYNCENLKHIYYGGSESDAENIRIVSDWHEDNGSYKYLCDATWYFNFSSYPTITIDNNPDETAINYGDGIKFTASVNDLPDGALVAWRIGEEYLYNPSDYEDEDSGLYNSKTYTCADIREDTTITVAVTDVDGNILRDADGNEIFDTETIKVKGGFWQKIVSFFKNLFGVDRIISQ